MPTHRGDLRMPAWPPARCILALALAILVGCAPIQIALGTRMRLEKIAVKELSAQLQEGTGLWPGGSAPLVVKVHSEDGKEFTSTGAGRGKVLWDSFRIDSIGAPGAAVSRNGVVKLDQDPRAYSAQPLRLRITALSTPSRSTDLELPVRYDVPFEARYHGADGFPGMSGSDGSPGSSGSSGSMDPENPSAGGRGGDGGDGGDGSSGGDGGAGPDVQVFMTLQPGARRLQVRVEAPKSVRFFLVDPDGGSLFIRSEGGSGGSGGRGGSGGSGGNGGMGLPSGSSGSSGLAGRDGSSGRPGPDGRITVWVDASAKPFLNVLRWANRDGQRHGFLGLASQGVPAPEIREAQVGPLW